LAEGEPHIRKRPERTYLFTEHAKTLDGQSIIKVVSSLINLAASKPDASISKRYLFEIGREKVR
jgi:hypothetical protein